MLHGMIGMDGHGCNQNEVFDFRLAHKYKEPLRDPNVAFVGLRRSPALVVLS